MTPPITMNTAQSCSSSARRFASDFKVRAPARSSTTVSLLCTPFVLRERRNQHIFVHIKNIAMPMAFCWNKYSIQVADFQDEAIRDVTRLADK